MAHDDPTPEEDFADRLFRRRNLKRGRGPDGGEVFQGPAATRALKALGAKAMTVDGSIVVADDFDPSSPEDAALYAHEQHHVEMGDTRATHPVHDAEEQAARAVQQLTFHRMISREAEAGGGGDAGGGGEDGGDEAAGDPVAEAYDRLVGQGFSPQQIEQLVAERVVQLLEEKKELGEQRFSDLGRSYT